MSRPIAVYGAGGHGLMVADIAKALGFAPFFIDDGDNEWEKLDAFLQCPRHCPIALGVGDNETRKTIYERLVDHDIEIATLIHPSAVIGSNVKIAEGTVVMPGAVINAESRIGRGVIVNTAAVVEHECVVEDFVHLSPHVALAGRVRIGEQTHIGIGACVIQNIYIAQRCIVGAGAAVINHLPSRVTAVGVPARIIKERS